MAAVAIALCLIPTLYEVWEDRNGEGRTDKTRDAIVAVIMYAAVALVNWWWLDVHPLRSLALTFGFRVLLFDYMVQYVLIKRGVIHGHWFFFKGKTAKWDRVIKYLNPWVVLACRLVVFGIMLTIAYCVLD